MRFLSQWQINTDSSQVLRIIGDCYKLHQQILKAFPDRLIDRKADLSLLYRVEKPSAGNEHIILIQSKLEPNQNDIVAVSFAQRAEVNELRTKDYSPFISSLTEGRNLRFLIHLNPCIKTGTSSKEERLSGNKSNGRRVTIRKHEDLVTWFERKSVASGFLISSLTIGEKISKTGYKQTNGMAHRITCEGYAISGILRIKDKALFIGAIENGIGSGKAFGFGLLSIAPIG